jgi:hypothetical protein
MEFPITELLFASFLAGFDKLLHSYTIWDHCATHLHATYNGGDHVASMEDLLHAFEPMLAPIVIDKIRATLDALRDSVLGVEIALLPSFGAFSRILCCI